MIEYKTVRAIVLHVLDHEEYNARVYCYTLQYGLIIFKAQGLKKPQSKLAYHIIPGNIVYLTLYKKRVWNLTGAKTILESGITLHSLEHYRAFCALRELMLSLVPHEHPDPGLYQLFEKFIYYTCDIENNSTLRTLAIYRFTICVLERLGHFPDYHICQLHGERIQSSGDLYWKKGVGFVCGRTQKDGTSIPDSLYPLQSYITFFTPQTTHSGTMPQGAQSFAILETIIKEVFEKSSDRELVSYL